MNLTLGRRGLHQWTTAGAAGTPLCLSSTSRSASGPHPGMVEGARFLQEWLIHKRTLFGALGLRVGPPSGGADSRAPPLEWLADQCTFQWSRWSTKGRHHVTGGGPTLLPLGLLTIGEDPLVLLVHRRAFPGVLGPRAGLPWGGDHQ